MTEFERTMITCAADLDEISEDLPDPDRPTKARLLPDGRLLLVPTTDLPAEELDINAVGADEALRAYEAR